MTHHHPRILALAIIVACCGLQAQALVAKNGQAARKTHHAKFLS